jgi:uncharacterized protein YjbI with pentapeptide repeats
MANKVHLENLKMGVEHWNAWRAENSIEPDLSGENLTRINLSGANLAKADFSKCNLSKANFSSAILNDSFFLLANLYAANLRNTNLNNARFVNAELYESDLSGAQLIEADLSNANLTGANLTGANLSNADLSEAKLTNTNLSDTNLNGSNLSLAICVETNLNNSNIEGSRIYGVSAWNMQIEGLKQKNLIITRFSEPAITLDNIEVAQFIYLILNNKKIRDVIGTIAKKGVLILGRFTPERKKILDIIRDKLRENDFLPIMFDFEKVDSRDFTETIKILAGMSRFVIADITNPKSTPMELQATVPDYQIPFLPIIQFGEDPFSMFIDLQKKYSWVLPTMRYSSEEGLLKGFKKNILEKALEADKKLFDAKQSPPPPIQDIEDIEE